jgi:hypothetical protein
MVGPGTIDTAIGPHFVPVAVSVNVIVPLGIVGPGGWEIVAVYSVGVLSCGLGDGAGAARVKVAAFTVC